MVCLQEAWDTPDDAEAGGELKDAESSVSEFSHRLGGAWWQKFAEVRHCTLYRPSNVYLACDPVLICCCTNVIAVRIPCVDLIITAVVECTSSLLAFSLC